MKMMKSKDEQGQAMRRARRRLGIRQLDLARQVGCTESQITKFETGRSMPHMELKAAIATALGIQTWEVGV